MTEVFIVTDRDLVQDERRMGEALVSYAWYAVTQGKGPDDEVDPRLAEAAVAFTSGFQGDSNGNVFPLSSALAIELLQDPEKRRGVFAAFATQKASWGREDEVE